VDNKSIACRSLLEEGRLSYRASGVDITAADALVSTIKRTAALTNRTGMLGSIGGFGGLFDTKAAGYRDPLLVSGTDGVGTKLKVYVGSCFRGTYFLHLQGKINVRLCYTPASHCRILDHGRFIVAEDVLHLSRTPPPVRCAIAAHCHLLFLNQPG
jgi:hypothetical protein